MKKKRCMIVVLIAIFVVCILFLVIREVIIARTIPHIAFSHNTSRAKCLYICSDGNIYASTSEESFEMENSELAERIKQEDYDDILVYVGHTNVRMLRKMYRLFTEVVIKQEYGVYPTVIEVPNSGEHDGSGEYGGSEGYWGGYYYDENRDIKYDSIYVSNADMRCTDERALEIVDWMYETLKDYMK